MNIKTAEIIGYVGIVILIGVLLYLTFKILGVFHSLGLEEVLWATMIGQLFYIGYNHKALKEIERRLEKIERKLKL